MIEKEYAILIHTIQTMLDDLQQMLQSHLLGYIVDGSEKILRFQTQTADPMRKKLHHEWLLHLNLFERADPVQ